MPTVALLSWIVIAPFLATRLTASQIVIWLTLIPYLFLPERFAINLSGLPDIDKTAAVSLGLLLAYVFHLDKFRAARRKMDPTTGSSLFKWVIGAFFALMLVGNILTLLTNPEPLFYGPVVLPGLRPWDSIGVLSGLVFRVIPFVFAWYFLSTAEAQKEFLRALVVMGLIYSLLMLFEVRFSPQLHTWTYGYFQHNFFQHVRGGFRPIVFLEHGIWVGFFMFMTIVAAFTVWRSTQETKWLVAAIWLFLVLGVSRNMGAVVICFICFGMMLMTVRLRIRFAAILAFVILFYPALRQAQLIPTTRIVDWAAIVSDERAFSLQFRLDSEDTLLERALLKPLAGWGGYSREQIFDDWGKKISVPDGLWILEIGTKGWVGYLALFGVLTFPSIFLWLWRRGQSPPPETIGLVLIITGNLVYMIPNATLTPVCWLAFGALSGFLRYGEPSADTAKTVEETQTPSEKRDLIYSRFPSKPRSSLESNRKLPG